MFLGIGHGGCGLWYRYIRFGWRGRLLEVLLEGCQGWEGERELGRELVRRLRVRDRRRWRREVDRECSTDKYRARVWTFKSFASQTVSYGSRHTLGVNQNRTRRIGPWVAPWLSSFEGLALMRLLRY